VKNYEKDNIWITWTYYTLYVFIHEKFFAGLLGNILLPKKILKFPKLFLNTHFCTYHFFHYGWALLSDNKR